MPLPFLHILHPADAQLPGIVTWLGEVELTLRSDAEWNSCKFFRTEYTAQASFHVPTVSDLILQNLGPVIAIQPVQMKLIERLQKLVARRTVVNLIAAHSPAELLDVCRGVYAAYNRGEPLLPIREVIAYLILAKLNRHGYWGGSSLNKNFLWATDLPKGGFPKDFEKSEINDVAEQLIRCDLLHYKISGGGRKFALGEKRVVQPILDTKDFGVVTMTGSLGRFFAQSRRLASASLLDYNE